MVNETRAGPVSLQLEEEQEDNISMFESTNISISQN